MRITAYVRCFREAQTERLRYHTLLPDYAPLLEVAGKRATDNGHLSWYALINKPVEAARAREVLCDIPYT